MRYGHILLMLMVVGLGARDGLADVPAAALKNLQNVSPSVFIGNTNPLISEGVLCPSEIHDICKGITDPQAIDACLHDHIAETGYLCKGLLDAAEGTIKKDCPNEIASFCPKTGFGGGRMRECLMKHGDQLSASCQKHFGIQK